MVQRWRRNRIGASAGCAYCGVIAVIPREKAPGASVYCAEHLVLGDEVKENADPPKASRRIGLKGNSARGLVAVQTCLRW